MYSLARLGDENEDYHKKQSVNELLVSVKYPM